MSARPHKPQRWEIAAAMSVRWASVIAGLAFFLVPALQLSLIGAVQVAVGIVGGYVWCLHIEIRTQRWLLFELVLVHAGRGAIRLDAEEKR